MTVEQSSDLEAAPKAAPKNSRRTTTKAQPRKKTASSDTPVAEENSLAAAPEKKKTPARRTRKNAASSPTVASDITQNASPVITQDGIANTSEEKNTSGTFQKEEENAVALTPKARAVRAKSATARSRNVKKAEKSVYEEGDTESVSVSTEVLPAHEGEDFSRQEQKMPKPSRAKAVRGRPKKVRDEEVKPDLTALKEATPVSDEPQSAGIERPVSEVPDMPAREEKKSRRPRRSVKTKISPAQAGQAAQADISAKSSAAQDMEEQEEASYTEQDEFSAASPKSRRGRRGGRGKRGKKRPLALMEEAQEYFDDADADDISLSLKKTVPAAAKGGTSLSEGKPGRARTLPVKKGAETAQRKMFISMVQGEQVEVALVENGIIHEYYLEMLHQVKTKGNIYKGVVNNIDANLQAAFISYGANKNGFLQIDEIHPEYYQSHHDIPKGKKFPPIQKIIKPGQEILVQVVKEPTGNKGAFLTTWLSLPGRFLVLTPGQEQIGISRKVESDEERGRLREMMSGIEPGAGLGVIVRTVSAGTSKTTLKSDLQYLKRVWKEIRKRGVSDTAPALLYRESSLAERAIRDYLTDDVTEVWVDNTDVAESLRETVALLFPRKKELIRMHADVRQTLWERFNMHRQLEQIYAREVVLPSGGRLVFDQTEALMAIDINSGKISGKGNFESMALKTNIEAAEAIARHLKLRDIGGQVVVDFIEMRDKSHVREVEKTLRNAMKNDRARHDVARISSFGLLEIVRQRTGSSALAITMEPCPHCRGTGVRRNLEWQALQALCEMERKGRSAQQGKYVFETSSTELALYLLNHKRQRISELEEQLHISIEVRMQ